jgi:hypothetical protein
MDFLSLGGELANLTGFVQFRLPGGCRVQVCAGQENPFVKVRLEAEFPRPDTLVVRLRCRNCQDYPLFLECLAPASLEADVGGTTALGESVTAWTMLAGGLGPGVRALCTECFSHKARDFHARDYALFGNNARGRYLLFGFLEFDRQDTRIALHAERDNVRLEQLVARCELAGCPLPPGAQCVSEPLLVRVGGAPAQMMLEYTDELARRHGPRRRFPDLTGWATWDYYQRGITEAEVMRNVRWLAEHRSTVPVSYIQLDDGYEVREGDWLLANEKFPHGLKWLADEVHAAGFQAGLWVCPFLAAPQSRVAVEHPEWLLRGRTGAPLVLNGYAVREVHGLDCTVPGVLDYLRGLAHALTVDYGFDYLKLDGANRQVLSRLGFPQDAGVGRGEAMRRGLAAFREGMRPGAILLNGSTFGLSLGISDAMRVGEDAGGRWDASKIAKDHGERDRFNGPGEVLRAIAAANNHFYLHKRLWTNDPDYLVVRQEGLNSELSLEEARSWATVVAMSQGTVMLADPPGELLPERLEIVEKILPHAPAAARPVDFFRRNVPAILAMPLRNAVGDWLLVSVTNTDLPKRNRDYVLDFQELGLDPDSDYRLFEFWTSADCGTARGAFTVRDLPPHHTRLFAIRRHTGALQILGTDAHFTMGAVEITAFDGRMLHVRPRPKPWRVFFALPESGPCLRGLRRHSAHCGCLEIPPGATEAPLK